VIVAAGWPEVVTVKKTCLPAASCTDDADVMTAVFDDTTSAKAWVASA
jgi:hypothetical protein